MQHDEMTPPINLGSTHHAVPFMIECDIVCETGARLEDASLPIAADGLETA
jgi:hypothetical protein